MAFDRLSPIDGRRLDWNAAMIAATIASVFGGKRQRIEKHLLTWSAGKKKTPQELEAEMMGWALRHNAALEKKRKRKG